MENNNAEHKDINWLVVLMIFLNYDNHLYSKFTDSLSSENRFKSTDDSIKFFNKFKFFTTQAVGWIPRDSTLYRARVIDERYNTNITKEFIRGVTDKDFQDSENILLKSTLTAESLFASIFPLLCSKSEGQDKIKDFFQEYRNRIFQGFNAKQSGATPPDKAPEGRLNPQKVSYLYMAEEPETAIYEVKPIVQQAISLATIKPIRHLKVLDLCKEFPFNEFIQEGYTLSPPSLMREVAHRFSIPNHGDIMDYIPTQYIAEYVKTVLEFDGIKFKSSLNNGGKNVVIFDEKLCEVTGSKVYCIDKIKIDYHSLNQDIERINWENSELGIN